MNFLFKLNWYPLWLPHSLLRYHCPNLLCNKPLSYAKGLEPQFLYTLNCDLFLFSFWVTLSFSIWILTSSELSSRWPQTTHPSPMVRDLSVSPTESSGRDAMRPLRHKFQPSPMPRFIITPKCKCHPEEKERGRCWGREVYRELFVLCEGHTGHFLTWGGSWTWNNLQKASVEHFPFCILLHVWPLQVNK